MIKFTTMNNAQFFSKLIQNHPEANNSNPGKEDNATRGYLRDLYGLPMDTPSLIFNCDFYDGTVGAWVSTNCEIPLTQQVAEYFTKRRRAGLTTRTLAGVLAYHCSSINQALLVGEYLNAPCGSRKERECFFKFHSNGGHITPILTDEKTTLQFLEHMGIITPKK
jgi:hypothetical protein